MLLAASSRSLLIASARLALASVFSVHPRALRAFAIERNRSAPDYGGQGNVDVSCSFSVEQMLSEAVRRISSAARDDQGEPRSGGRSARHASRAPVPPAPGTAQGELPNIACTCGIVRVASSATVRIAPSPRGNAGTTKAITSRS